MVHNLTKWDETWTKPTVGPQSLSVKAGSYSNTLAVQGTCCVAFIKEAPLIKTVCILAGRVYASSSHPTRLAVWNVIQLLRLSVLFYRSQCTHSDLEFNSRHRACVCSSLRLGRFLNRHPG